MSNSLILPLNITSHCHPKAKPKDLAFATL